VNWTYAGVIGGFLGVVVGVGASQLRVPPLVQSLAAVFAAVVVSTALIFFLGFRSPVLAGDAGDGYFSFGVENLLYLVVLLVVGAVLHVALGVFGAALPWVAEHRAVILGGASGLYSAVSVATALTSLSRVRLG
jgi:hypothetical protein